ncbi:YfhE family protein [Oceanobacillus halotolerans]|nr:YfhE family protein [Oceanobacillus halotolerans]
MDKKNNERLKFLSKTQEVLYQRDFKKADKASQQFTKPENRS